MRLLLLGFLFISQVSLTTSSGNRQPTVFSCIQTPLPSSSSALGAAPELEVSKFRVSEGWWFGLQFLVLIPVSFFERLPSVLKCLVNSHQGCLNMSALSHSRQKTPGPSVSPAFSPLLCAAPLCTTEFHLGPTQACTPHCVQQRSRVTST